MTKVSAIVAVGKNNVIGRRGNGLIWRISEDLKRFRRITMGHPIIMGRKTFESIGKALPGRVNIVITKGEDFEAKNCLVAHSINAAIQSAKKLDAEEIFVIGGGEIYEQSLPQIDKLYITIINDSKDGDVFFPDYSDFTKEIFREEHKQDDLKYTWIDLERE